MAIKRLQRKDIAEIVGITREYFSNAKKNDPKRYTIYTLGATAMHLGLTEDDLYLLAEFKGKQNDSAKDS